MNKLFAFIFLLLAENSFCLPNEAVITVRCNYKYDVMTLFFVSDAILYKNVSVLTKRDSINDSFTFRLQVGKPVLAELLDQTFLVFPGDSIEITEKDGDNGTKHYGFSGKNSENYSFFIDLQKIPAFRARELKINDTTELINFKHKAREHYSKTLTFHSEYTLSKNTSEEFNRITKYLLDVFYYDNLTYPIYKRKLRKFDLPGKYFADLDTSIFKQPELLCYRDYVLLMDQFNQYYFSYTWGSVGASDTVKAKARISSLKENFPKEISAALLLKTYGDFVNNGSLSLTNIIVDLRSYLLAVYNTDTGRLNQIEELYHRFNILGRKLPARVLSLNLINVDGQNISFGEMLAQTKKAVYVDFWASWCAPCKEEMPVSDSLYRKLGPERKIEFLYISLDTSEKKWRISMNSVNVSGRHFLMPDNFKSSLVSYLKFNTIPRYLIIDQEGVLINYDAPRPSESSKLLEIFKTL